MSGKGEREVVREGWGGRENNLFICGGVVSASTNCIDLS